MLSLSSPAGAESASLMLGNFQGVVIIDMGVLEVRPAPTYKQQPLGTVCMYGHTYSKNMDQPGKVANPARGQLNRENEYVPVRVRT